LTIASDVLSTSHKTRLKGNVVLGHNRGRYWNVYYETLYEGHKWIELAHSAIRKRSLVNTVMNYLDIEVFFDNLRGLRIIPHESVLFMS